jgi:hypothetical protein
MSTDKDKKVQEIWKNVFDVLGVGGFNPEDAASESLSKINFGRQSGEKTTFKGKKAVLKRLANGQIFDKLKQVGDPELAKTVERAEQWLGTEESEPEHSSNASTTVGELLKMLFGQKYFDSFIGSDFPKDNAKAKVQPQAPKTPDQGAPNGSMDQNTPQPQPPGAPPMAAGPMTQPQAPGNMQPPAPTNPMPPAPAGANMGLF